MTVELEIRPPEFVTLGTLSDLGRASLSSFIKWRLYLVYQLHGVIVSTMQVSRCEKLFASSNLLYKSDSTFIAMPSGELSLKYLKFLGFQVYLPLHISFA